MTNPTQRRFRFAAVLAAGGQASLLSEVFASVFVVEKYSFCSILFFQNQFFIPRIPCETACLPNSIRTPNLQPENNASGASDRLNGQ